MKGLTEDFKNCCFLSIFSFSFSRHVGAKKGSLNMAIKCTFVLLSQQQFALSGSFEVLKTFEIT